MPNHDHGSGRHEHGGMSSRGSFQNREVLLEAGLRSGAVFLDAGCGDGHFSITASEIVGPDGLVFSFDKHTYSLELLNEEVDDRWIENIVVNRVDLTQGVPLRSGSIDMIFFSNVIHGFVYNGEMESVMKWAGRVLKEKGRIAVIEFRKEETPNGPPVDHRVSSDELMDIFSGLNLKLLKTKEITEDHDLFVFGFP
ncbi:MAG: class I SAM-dependent methyltransferase [Thermoplasmatota archaeon]